MIIKQFMFYRELLAAVTLLLAFNVAGCEKMKLVRLYFQEQQYVKDQILIAKIRGAFLADPALADAPIKISAYLEDVTLSGTVDSRAQALQAVATARAVEGVKSVYEALIVKERREVRQ